MSLLENDSIFVILLRMSLSVFILIYLYFYIKICINIPGTNYPLPRLLCPDKRSDWFV